MFRGRPRECGVAAVPALRPPLRWCEPLPLHALEGRFRGSRRMLPLRGFAWLQTCRQLELLLALGDGQRLGLGFAIFRHGEVLSQVLSILHICRCNPLARVCRVTPRPPTSNWMYWFLETPAAEGVVMLTTPTPFGATRMVGRWALGAGWRRSGLGREPLPRAQRARQFGGPRSVNPHTVRPTRRSSATVDLHAESAF